MRSLRWSLLLGLSILAGCGGGGGGGGGGASVGSSTTAVASSSNVVALSVNAGPAAAMGGTFNIPYTSITICAPGTTTCAQIDHVLVDTGSTGLRLMASALKSAGLRLPDLADPNNSANTIGECLPFVDGYTWGPLAVATLKMGGETANNLSINIINDDGSFNTGPPPGCSTMTGATSLNSVQAFSANGVLGVGVFAQDCGTSCANCNASGSCTPANDIYYSCNTVSNFCAPIPVAIEQQVQNPVVLFATDNNGVILELPAISATGTTTASGTLIFGIGTQSNNGLGTATVLKTNSAGFMTTIFNGQTLTNSFIDSGSNGYYFNDSSLATCTGAAQFYCPPAMTTLSVTNEGTQGAVSTLSFQIGDLNSISTQNYAIANVGGTAATSSGSSMLNNDFDFGLSFFYGRRVYTAIEGLVAGSATGPYFAY